MPNRDWWTQPEFLTQVERAQKMATEAVSGALPAIRTWEKQSQALKRQLEGLFASLPSVSALARQQEEAERFVRAVIDTDAFRRFGQLLKESEPPNWPQDSEEELTQLVDRTQWPLVWIPRSHVLEQLLACGSDDDALEKVLLEREDEILDACLEQLDQIAPDRFAEEVVSTREAISAYPLAPRATQSLAVTTFEAVLRQTLGYDTLSQAASELRELESWEETPFQFFRWTLIRSCMPSALENYRREKGDPVPTKFNRHASLHALGPEQYRRSNALVGVMMVTAPLRELHQLVEDGILPPP